MYAPFLRLCFEGRGKINTSVEEGSVVTFVARGDVRMPRDVQLMRRKEMKTRKASVEFVNDGSASVTHTRFCRFINAECSP